MASKARLRSIVATPSALRQSDLSSVRSSVRSSPFPPSNEQPASESLESLLGSLSLFEALRLDEVGRIAGRFRIETLVPAEERSFGTDVDGIRMVVILAGRVEMAAETVAAPLHATLEPGDRYGDLALQTATRGWSRFARRRAVKAPAWPPSIAPVSTRWSKSSPQWRFH